MGKALSYCLDTYALVEIVNGNQAYLDIVLSNFVIPIPVLAEFYDVLLKSGKGDAANYWYHRLKNLTISIHLPVWIKAVQYRRKHSKESLSIFDCIGYQYSLESGSEFVTGDQQFKGKKGVMYIK